MFVRRGQATVRLGAGLLLAMTCAAAPAVALAPPAAGAPTPPGACNGVPASASTDAESYELGSTVTITGRCFEPYTMAEISIITPDADGPVPLGEKKVSADGSVTWTYPTEDPGDFGAVVKVDDPYQEADAKFTVTDAEEPAPGNGDEGDGPDNGDADADSGAGDGAGGTASDGGNG